jgi:hypothetical protein
MIFKNNSNLLTAITKKRNVDNARSDIQKKQKLNSRSTSSSTTTSTVSASVAPNKTDEVSNRRVYIPYKDKNAREGALVTMLVGKNGDPEPYPLRSVLLDKPKDDDHWYAYVLKKNKDNHLFCPFCSITCDPKGFTNHTKSCRRKNKKTKKRLGFG